MAISCSNEPPKFLHFEAEGLVVIEPEIVDSVQGWKHKDYYTGIGLTSDTVQATLSFPVDFKHTGNWYIWILGRPNLSKLDEGEFTLSSYNSSVAMSLDSSISLEWMNKKPNGKRANLLIDKLGIQEITLKAEYKSFYIDKIILAHSEEFKPIGYGPRTTSSADVLPITDKNQEEIVLPPYWAFGVLYGGYTNQTESISRVQTLLKGNYPIDAYWIDSWFWNFTNKGDGPDGYMDFKQDEEAFPNPAEMWQMMGEKGIRSGVWVWNGILQKGNESVFDDFEKRGFFSGTYTERGGWHNKGNNSVMGNIDFENPEAVAYYKSKLRPYFEQGLDFVKIDRSSALPFTKAAFEMAQEFGEQTLGRGFVLAHVHSTYNPEFKKYPTKWTGDAKIDWNQPVYPNMFQYAMGAYRQNLDMVSNPQKTTYEAPFMAHDAGGYSFFGAVKTDEELFIRWTQFAAFSPVMTLFSATANPTSNMPFNYSKKAQESFKNHTQLRHRLFPYIYTYAHLTRLHEKRLISSTSELKDQFLFGDAFYVAPMVEKGASSRTLTLPAGNWLDFWTEFAYSGGKEISIQSDLTHIPLFVKSGSIIPMKIYTQTLDKNFSRDLEIHYYNSDEASDFTLIEDDGLSNEYKTGSIAKAYLESAWVDGVKTFVIHPVEGSFTGMPTKRTIKLIIHQIEGVSSVEVNSETIRSFAFDAKKKQVTINLGETSYQDFTRVRVR